MLVPLTQVKLVRRKSNNKVYALKILKKVRIVRLRQKSNIMNEKNLLLMIDHPFILKLYTTYKDNDHLYMLLELVQGGELFSRLQSNGGRVGVRDAQFYGAGVLDAFEHLHSKHILYRDLKPENLLIDSKGYIKVVDFGFAKVVPDRTYTLCGTPEYLAPELVLGKGHDKGTWGLAGVVRFAPVLASTTTHSCGLSACTCVIAGVDYWALGILIYEMVCGYSPFADHENCDQMKICKNILKGQLKFPQKCSDRRIKDLISRLLEQQIARRLGCGKGGAGDVKAHPFFKSVNWKDLVAKRIAAPWKPRLKGLLDTSFFDDYDERDRENERYKDDGTGWDRYVKEGLTCRKLRCPHPDTVLQVILRAAQNFCRFVAISERIAETNKIQFYCVMIH